MEKMLVLDLAIGRVDSVYYSRRARAMLICKPMYERRGRTYHILPHLTTEIQYHLTTEIQYKYYFSALLRCMHQIKDTTPCICIVGCMQLADVTAR